MRAIVVLIIALCMLFATAARADDADKQKCLAAYVAGQDAREKGRLRDARVELETCGQDHCPTAVRKDCVEWLAQVTSSLPSVVVASVDDEGKEITNATITLDGQPFSMARDGRAVPIDPGPHTFKFDAPEHEPQTVEIVILEGQKNRLVSGKLVRKQAPKSIPKEYPRRPYQSRLYGIIIGGAAIASFAVFAGYGISGASDMRDLESGCGATQSCKQEDVDDARAKLITADAFLVTGIVAGAISAYFLLFR